MNDDQGIGKVYFIQAEKDGSVKIGYTANIERRIKALQTSTPQKLELLAAIPASMAIEKSLHKKYKKYRISGEWFRSSQELLDDIEKYKSNGFEDSKLSKFKPKESTIGDYVSQNRFQLVYVAEDFQWDIRWFSTEKELRDYVENSGNVTNIVNAFEIYKARDIKFDDGYY